MATEKTKGHFAATMHALVYSLPFIVLVPSPVAWFTIFSTHEIIDRYRLARYICWAKNWLGPNRPWRECTKTGYPEGRPDWLAVWLMIFADNILHIVINGMALKYL
jgi:hypothetical protein